MLPAAKRHPLAGLRILIVEDELLCAMELEQLLIELECVIVGPVAHVRDVMPAVNGERLDGALLDVNLHGERSYPAASALRSLGVPIVMVTGYGGLPDCPVDLKDVPTVNKPFDRVQIERAMTAAMQVGEGRSG